MNPRMITIGGLILAAGVGMASGALAAESQTATDDRMHREGVPSRPELSSAPRETPADRETSVANDKQAGGSAESGQAMLVYKPPMRGAPKGRIGGGTRGIGQAFTIAVLAPDHVGLTTRAQPVLYWYAGQAMTAPVEFTLIDGGVEPLVEAALSPPDRPGIYRIELSDYGVELEPGRRYQWFVALVLDRDRRSRDILAGGMIERVESSRDLVEKLHETPAGDQPAVYAEAGIWYDAVEAVSREIEQAPERSALRKQRAAIAQQVGLLEVAAFDADEK